MERRRWSRKRKRRWEEEGDDDDEDDDDDGSQPSRPLRLFRSGNLLEAMNWFSMRFGAPFGVIGSTCTRVMTLGVAPATSLVRTCAKL